MPRIRKPSAKVIASILAAAAATASSSRTPAPRRNEERLVEENRRLERGIVKAGQRRLPKEANVILDHHYRNVSTRPPHDDRVALLEEIHRIAGTEWYTIKHVSNFFKDRRKHYIGIRHHSKKGDGHEPKQAEATVQKAVRRKRAKPEAEPPVETKDLTTGMILWPSLDAAKIQKLSVLCRENPNADESMRVVWCRALEAKDTDVENWIQLNWCLLPEALAVESDKTSGHALLTPAPTISPEPEVQRMAASPIMSHVAPEQIDSPDAQPESAVCSEPSSSTPALTIPVSSEDQAASQRREMFKGIACSVKSNLLEQANARMNQSDGSATGDSLTEYLDRCSSFLDNIISGCYAPLGLTADLVPDEM